MIVLIVIVVAQAFAQIQMVAYKAVIFKIHHTQQQRKQYDKWDEKNSMLSRTLLALEWVGSSLVIGNTNNSTSSERGAGVLIGSTNAATGGAMSAASLIGREVGEYTGMPLSPGEKLTISVHQL